MSERQEFKGIEKQSHPLRFQGSLNSRLDQMISTYRQGRMRFRLFKDRSFYPTLEKIYGRVDYATNFIDILENTEQRADMLSDPQLTAMYVLKSGAQQIVQEKVAPLTPEQGIDRNMGIAKAFRRGRGKSYLRYLYGGELRVGLRKPSDRIQPITLREAVLVQNTQREINPADQLYYFLAAYRYSNNIDRGRQALKPDYYFHEISFTKRKGKQKILPATKQAIALTSISIDSFNRATEDPQFKNIVGDIPAEVLKNSRTMLTSTEQFRQNIVSSLFSPASDKNQTIRDLFKVYAAHKNIYDEILPHLLTFGEKQFQYNVYRKARAYVQEHPEDNFADEMYKMIENYIYRHKEETGILTKEEIPFFLTENAPLNRSPQPLEFVHLKEKYLPLQGKLLRTSLSPELISAQGLKTPRSVSVKFGKTSMEVQFTFEYLDEQANERPFQLYCNFSKDTIDWSLLNAPDDPEPSVVQLTHAVMASVNSLLSYAQAGQEQQTVVDNKPSQPRKITIFAAQPEVTRLFGRKRRQQVREPVEEQKDFQSPAKINAKQQAIILANRNDWDEVHSNILYSERHNAYNSLQQFNRHGGIQKKIKFLTATRDSQKPLYEYRHGKWRILLTLAENAESQNNSTILFTVHKIVDRRDLQTEIERYLK